MSEWKGNLRDDCSLERYGCSAHVEMMDKGVWWFAVYRNKKIVFNSFESLQPIRLETGKQARLVAEFILEIAAMRKLKGCA